MSHSRTRAAQEFIGKDCGPEFVITGIKGRNAMGGITFLCKCRHCGVDGQSVTWDKYSQPEVRAALTCKSALCAQRLLKATARVDTTLFQYRADRQAEAEAPLKAAEAARKSAEEKQRKQVEAHNAALARERVRRQWHDEVWQPLKEIGETTDVVYAKWLQMAPATRARVIELVRERVGKHKIVQAAPEQVDRAWLAYEKQCTEKGIVPVMQEFLAITADGTEV